VPGFAEQLPRLATAVNGKLAGGDVALHEGDEIALLPPVSGGSPQSEATRLTDDPIDIDDLVRQVSALDCGAVVTFSGTVRNHHDGKQVVAIEYHAYRDMAEITLDTIVSEILAAHDHLRLDVVHRLGPIPLGESSVAIVSAAPHRGAAFEAVRETLERLKREVPIWKLETYEDGERTWREEESLAPPPGDSGPGSSGPGR
jgi:molybdopterin synthase catalytic subunit